MVSAGFPAEATRVSRRDHPEFRRHRLRGGRPGRPCPSPHRAEAGGCHPGSDTGAEGGVVEVDQGDAIPFSLLGRLSAGCLAERLRGILPFPYPCSRLELPLQLPAIHSRATKNDPPPRQQDRIPPGYPQGAWAACPPEPPTEAGSLSLLQSQLLRSLRTPWRPSCPPSPAGRRRVCLCGSKLFPFS